MKAQRSSSEAAICNCSQPLDQGPRGAFNASRCLQNRRSGIPSSEAMTHTLTYLMYYCCNRHRYTRVIPSNRTAYEDSASLDRFSSDTFMTTYVEALSLLSHDALQKRSATMQTKVSIISMPRSAHNTGPYSQNPSLNKPMTLTSSYETGLSR